MFSETCREMAHYKINHSPPLALLQVPKTEFKASWPRKELNLHGILLLPPQGLCCLLWSCSTASPARKWVGLEYFSLKKSSNGVWRHTSLLVCDLTFELWKLLLYCIPFLSNGFYKSTLEWSSIHIKSYFSLETYHLYSSVDFFTKDALMKKVPYTC